MAVLPTAAAPACQQTCDKDGRADQAQGAMHNFQHRRCLRHLERQLHRLHARHPRVIDVQLATVRTHQALLQLSLAGVAPARRPEARWRPRGLPLFPWWSCMSGIGCSSCRAGRWCVQRCSVQEGNGSVAAAALTMPHTAPCCRLRGTAIWGPSPSSLRRAPQGCLQCRGQERAVGSRSHRLNRAGEQAGGACD